MNKRALPDTTSMNEPESKRQKAEILNNGPSKTSSNGPSITKDEADLYDRQIRLWGMEAQQRMRQAKILVAGVSGLSNEICKNLVLSGVGAITILDAGIVDEKDLGAQFFLRKSDVGKNRAEAICARVQALNPRVLVKAVNAGVQTQPDAFFGEFDVVCLCNYDLTSQIRVDAICRTSGSKFYAAGTNGIMGYIQCDLKEHSYTETRKSSEKEDAVTTTSEKSATYPSLKDIQDGRWEAADLKQLSRKQLRAMKQELDPVYFAFSVLWQFRNDHGRVPIPGQESDVDSLFKTRDSYMQARGCDPAFLPDELLRTFAETSGAELSPVCAILGGFAAQDILRVLSGKDAPLFNFFAFNGEQSTGNIIKVPRAVKTTIVATEVESIDLD
ncbi:SUMO-activating enzyme subunit 1 [Thoreauomyces humboldtii]|nr:SUMO-activating enzyme subunit 1 [Thoreauomyces humboldtii]